MDDLNTLTIRSASDMLRKKDISAMELANASLNAIKASTKLNAIVRIDEDRTLNDAKAADARLAKGTAPTLCGIPLGIKDIFAVKGQKTQAASNILDGFVPPYESTATQNLWDEGAVFAGTANMDEFAMGSSNETSCYGPAVNPWRIDQNLVPGGSSGGSAAAVAADLVLGAMATDTGGSIRQPAAFTGTVGIKPTYGRVSRFGIIAFASSLDQAGPITKTVEDAGIMLNSICGHDPQDSTSANIDVPDFTTLIGENIKGQTIGIPKEYFLDDMDDELKENWDMGRKLLESAGANIKEISLPHTKYALATYYVIAPAEASSNLARYDGVRFGARAEIGSNEGIHDMYTKTRGAGFGDEVKRRIMMGAYVLSAGFYDAYYTRAQKIRTLIKRDFDEAFSSGIDAILTPTTPTPAFKLGAAQSADPVQMYLNDVFTITLNMAGLPGISIPSALSKSQLPMGLQLIGRAFEEAELLKIAHVLEKEVAFSDKVAKWW